MTNCRLCNSENIETIANLEHDGFEYTIVFCEGCDLLQSLEHHYEVSPEYIFLRPVDVDGIRVWCQGNHKHKAFQHWAKIIKRLKPNKNKLRLLDIGCGTGGFLEYANNIGFELHGFDASNAQVGYARKLFPNVRHAKGCFDYLDKYGDQNLLFDVVTLWDVLEHIRNPLDYLREVREVIRPGGLIYISTPNGLAKLWKLNLYKYLSINIDLCGELTPWEHVFYYSHRSLEILLSQSGFNVLKLGIVPCYQGPLSMFEISRRTLYFTMNMLPSKAFQIYAWASA